MEKSVIKTDERKDYNLKVLKYVQCIFAHLAGSKLQFYVPKGFWKHFRSVSTEYCETVKLIVVRGTVSMVDPRSPIVCILCNTDEPFISWSVSM